MIDRIETAGGSTSFVTYTAPGFVHAPLTTATCTAQPSGFLQLVTPGG